MLPPSQAARRAALAGALATLLVAIGCGDDDASSSNGGGSGGGAGASSGEGAQAGQGGSGGSGDPGIPCTHGVTPLELGTINAYAGEPGGGNELLVDGAFLYVRGFHEVHRIAKDASSSEAISFGGAVKDFAVHDGVLFVRRAFDPVIEAVDVETGNTLWTQTLELSDDAYAPDHDCMMAGDAGLVIKHHANNFEPLSDVVVLDSGDGTVVSGPYDGDWADCSSPQLSGDSFWWRNGIDIFRLDLTSGERTRIAGPGSDVSASGPFIADGSSAFVDGGEAGLVELDAAGAVVTQLSDAEAPWSTMMQDADTLFFDGHPDQGDRLFSISKQGGNVAVAIEDLACHTGWLADDNAFYCAEPNETASAATVVRYCKP